MKNLLYPLVIAAVALVVASPTAHCSPTAPGSGSRPHHSAGEFIAKFDKNGDKALDATELAAGIESMRQHFRDRHAKTGAGAETASPAGKAGRLPTPRDRASKLIEKFDKNGDGKLDETELNAAFTAIRERAAPHRRAAGGNGQKPAAPAQN